VLALIDEMGDDWETQNPNWVESLKDYIRVCIRLGIIECKTGNFEEGSDYVQKALGTSTELGILSQYPDSDQNVHFLGTLLENLREYVRISIGLGVNEFKSGNYKAVYGFVQKALEPMMEIVRRPKEFALWKPC